MDMLTIWFADDRKGRGGGGGGGGGGVAVHGSQELKSKIHGSRELKQTLHESRIIQRLFVFPPS